MVRRVVLEMKKQNVDVMLMPIFRMRNTDSWKNNDAERYFDILSQVDDVITLQTRYTSACMSKTGNASSRIFICACRP
jgi:uncharacterized phage-like protein YoqJ